MSKILKLLLTIIFLEIHLAYSKDYFIYSITQDFPMGFKNEILKKNFYVNIGSLQGVEEGETLNVYRTISRHDPYTTKKLYNHKVKIGELEIVHSESGTSIGKLKNLESESKRVQFEIRKFMIGDKVEIKVN